MTNNVALMNGRDGFFVFGSNSEKVAANTAAGNARDGFNLTNNNGLFSSNIATRMMTELATTRPLLASLGERIVSADVNGSSRRGVAVCDKSIWGFLQAPESSSGLVRSVFLV